MTILFSSPIYFYIMNFSNWKVQKCPSSLAFSPLDSASVGTFNRITLLIVLFFYISKTNKSSLQGLLNWALPGAFALKKYIVSSGAFHENFQRCRTIISLSLHSSPFSLIPYIFPMPDSAIHIPWSEKGMP